MPSQFFKSTSPSIILIYTQPANIVHRDNLHWRHNGTPQPTLDTSLHWKIRANDHNDLALAITNNPARFCIGLLHYTTSRPRQLQYNKLISPYKPLPMTAQQPVFFPCRPSFFAFYKPDSGQYHPPSQQRNFPPNSSSPHNKLCNNTNTYRTDALHFP